jgi:photosystem II stability/assembly factor-like uncharacterized protein
MPSARRLLFPLIALVLSATTSLAAEDEPNKGGPKELERIRYRLVGPAIGGRVSRVAGVAGDPLTYYAATASGGVWKSSDGGTIWKPVFDDQPVASIGSIAVAASDPSVVYVGAGEANIRGNVVAGDGIYKSTDAGKTWSHVFKQKGQIGTLVVHPRNPDIAFAAVLGHAFGPNPERGVYRTTDGGRTWQRVLFKDADTGASDVAFDPSNPRIVFAGLWQARRRPWHLESGGAGSGLYVSRDGGDTWLRLEGKGLPGGVWGRVGVAVAPSDGRRVYALIEAEKGGLYRSDDGGESWSLASAHRSLRQRAWYYTTLSVDPANPDVVWFPQVPLLRTSDGGKTIKLVKEVHHGDCHDVWIDPKDPRRVIMGNDGGVDVSTNGGETWLAPPLPIAQLYHVAADNRVPYHVAGAAQDWGTVAGPSNSLRSGGIALFDWYGVGGGEAGYTAHDPIDPNLVYAGEYLGILTRFDLRTRQARNVTAYPANLSGHGAVDGRYRFNWTAPILVSPHDPKTVYHGGNVLLRTQDGGQSWTPISPDLTRDDESKQRWSGGPVTGDNTGAEFYGTLFAVAESPRQRGVIWAGSDDGLVHLTRDSGQTWTNLTPNLPRLPEWATISMIEPSPFDAGTAYVVADAHRLDDDRPHVYKTSDFGRSWKSLAATLPADVYLHALREDPKRRGLLYLGTERGVMVSRDDGATWSELRLNLPTVPVHDLVVKDDDLVVGTHGRSIWILDDLTPVREWSRAIAEAPAHLFAPPPAFRWRTSGEIATRYVKGAGANPPAGVTLSYWLKDKAKTDLKLEILDANGAVVRTFSSREQKPEEEEDDPDFQELPKPVVLKNEPGVQRVSWDLAHEGARKIPGAKIDSGNPGVGPLAVPGRYVARLTVDGQPHTVPIELRPDPRVSMTEAEYAEQLAFTLAVRDDVSRLTGIVAELRSVREQLRKQTEWLAANPAAVPLLAAARDLVASCDALEGRLHNPRAEVVYDILNEGARLYSQLSPLYSWAAEADGLPTRGMREMHAELRGQLDEREKEWRALVAGDLAALNRKARESGLAFVSVN